MKIRIPLGASLSQNVYGAQRLLLLTLLLAGCSTPGLNYDPSESEFVGAEATNHFSLCDRSKLPRSKSDEWVFDGGSFGGMIYYVSFTCETVEDCWKALDAFGSPGKSEFAEGVKTRFAVNKYGPSFYFPEFESPKWNISAVTNGVSYERVREDRNMDYWAIDFDTLRVYFHHESGGFPVAPPSKRHH